LCRTSIRIGSTYGVFDALFWRRMKAIAAVLLFALAVAYYFGYEPSDFIPSFSTTNTPPHRARHAPAPTEETPNPTPVRTSNSNVVAQAPNGSLADRWKP
jgi:hypothetical protein